MRHFMQKNHIYNIYVCTISFPSVSVDRKNSSRTTKVLNIEHRTLNMMSISFWVTHINVVDAMMWCVLCSIHFHINCFIGVYLVFTLILVKLYMTEYECEFCFLSFSPTSSLSSCSFFFHFYCITLRFILFHSILFRFHSKRLFSNTGHEFI